MVLGVIVYKHEVNNYKFNLAKHKFENMLTQIFTQLRKLSAGYIREEKNTCNKTFSTFCNRHSILYVIG